ncbi:MAG: DUF975 family protein, partial [Anaerovoracaceae bacterium]
MWKRSELKSEARTNLKQNYWVIVAVCFLMAFLFAEYGATTTFIDSYNSDKVMRMPAAEGRMADVEENVGHLVDKTIEDGASAESKATKGVLASMAKTIGKTKGVFSAMWQTLDQFIGQHAVLSGLVALGGLLLNILFAIFVKYILQVGERRFFLENKNHPGTRIGRIGFLYMERNIKNPAMVMLMRTIFYDLWCLTIIGAPIKWYSYKMVSYIVAENPDIHWKDALALSKAMMHGNKWRTFVLDISFWYWYLIKGMSFGAFGIFFLNPYVRATETELYVSLREHVIKMRI